MDAMTKDKDIHIRLDSELYEYVERYASEAHDGHMSDAVRDLLRVGLSVRRLLRRERPGSSPVLLVMVMLVLLAVAVAVSVIAGGR